MGPGGMMQVVGTWAAAKKKGELAFTLNLKNGENLRASQDILKYIVRVC
jgi:hypothetical protein